MFFNSIKEINRLGKEINSLLNKGASTKNFCHAWQILVVLGGRVGV